jgi:hypothetical protein
VAWLSVYLLLGARLSADLRAADPDGKVWAVEVKATAAITTTHRSQAMEQGKKARLPWMLVSTIHGTGCWLVQRQGSRPVVWCGDVDVG